MIELRGVTKQYLYGARVLGVAELRVEDGEIIALLGDGQSGKTTMLKVIAGVTDCEGEVLIDGSPTPKKPDDVLMVFDDLAVFENRSFYYNLAYPLKIRGVEKSEIERRVYAAAERIGITAWLKDKVSKAPLIQVKRLGLARLFLRDFRVLLIDDITHGLSRDEANELWGEVVPILLEKAAQGVSVMYATTDSSEAISVADRIAVLHYGEIKQVGTAKSICEKPDSIWAAQAIDKYYHFERARLEDNGGELQVVLGVQTPVSQGNEYRIEVEHLRNAIVGGYIGKDVYVGWHADSFADLGERNEKVSYAMRVKDGYIMRTESGIWVKGDEKCDTVCTLPKAADVRIFDFTNENSLHK
ncbi:MAG: ATP-binding cassette domain-containing protein [Clostridia bacterium]|nr:ATP-binding cassette domain-containing protein [Clostridia bacterium]